MSVTHPFDTVLAPEETDQIAPTVAAPPPGPRRGLLRRGAALAIAVAFAGGAAWQLLPPPPPAKATMPAITLGVAAPLVRDVVQWDDYVGRFAASQAVDVRPRVAGQIVAKHFRDGDLVGKGQLLFTIDPRPYAAALAEARAQVASARSSLTLARADWQRVSRLNGDEAVSAAEKDQLRARLDAASAALAAAQAREARAALDMEFTQVRAPIAGRVSDRRVDVGNLVAAGDGTNATLLTTISANDPIYFDFDASEALFLKARREQGTSGRGAQVQIRLQDEADYKWTGHLDFTDSGLDPHSGTIRVRAVLDNPQGFLTPGLFGSLRLANAGTTRALLVPDEAIVPDQARKTVMVVGRDGVVGAKPVELGPLVDGLRVIRSGLTPGDRVVVGNLVAATPGAQVSTRPEPITPQHGTATPGASAPAASQATFAR